MARVTFEPFPIPLARFAQTTVVYRLSPAPVSFTLLPNVVIESIQWREGPTPPVARFRYKTDAEAGDGRPLTFEQIYPYDAAGPLVVGQDDRVVVYVFQPDGSSSIFFSGFATSPQIDVGAEGQSVTFLAHGDPIREFDTPLGGMVIRDSSRADQPETDGVSNDVATDLPLHFNPYRDGVLQPNCTPDGASSGDAPDDYPVFLDPGTQGIDATDSPRPWTLAAAARYVLRHGNPDEKWTARPSFDITDTWLVSWEPVDGFLDAADPDTYEPVDIVVPETICQGEAWPITLAKMVEPHGVGIAWRLEEGADGMPAWRLEFFRHDVAFPLKHFSYQEHGEALDPGLTNVGSLNLARDVSALANRIVIDTDPVQYECSFVLGPNFTIASADATEPNRKYWMRTATDDFNPIGYRKFIFGEAGDANNGIWDFAADPPALDFTATSLARLLGTPGEKPDEQEAEYVARPRPGRGPLFTTDGKGERLRPRLHVSTNYTGPVPGIWHPEKPGKWNLVTSGSWRMLDDRLGITLTMPDARNWSAYVSPNNAAGANPPNIAGGKIDVVKALAAPDPANPRVVFMLTCVIDGDRGLGVVAEPRGISPTSYTITRREDQGDHFQKHVISKFSYPNGHKAGLLGRPPADIVARDDTDKALAFAASLQQANDVGTLAGAVTVPRLTFGYRVGDKVGRIDGRGMSLRSNVGGDQGEGPIYPVVTAIDWEMGGGQRTVIHLSDERARMKFRYGTRARR